MIGQAVIGKMAVSAVKLRLLYILKILMEKTAEAHTLSAAAPDRLFHGYGKSADRKTVYSDIDTLREAGIDILQSKRTNGS